MKSDQWSIGDGNESPHANQETILSTLLFPFRSSIASSIRVRALFDVPSREFHRNPRRDGVWPMLNSRNIISWVQRNCFIAWNNGPVFTAGPLITLLLSIALFGDYTWRRFNQDRITCSRFASLNFFQRENYVHVAFMDQIRDFWLKGVNDDDGLTIRRSSGERYWQNL